MDNRTGELKRRLAEESTCQEGLIVFCKRQPGSVLKPLIVYAPALETKKYNPYSLLTNEKVLLKDMNLETIIMSIERNDDVRCDVRVSKRTSGFFIK